MKVTLTKNEMRTLVPELEMIVNCLPEKAFGHSRKKVRKYIRNLIEQKITVEPSSNKERISIRSTGKKVVVDIPEDIMEHYVYFTSCEYYDIIYDMIDEMGCGIHREIATMLICMILCEALSANLPRKYAQIESALLEWHKDPTIYDELAKKIRECREAGTPEVKEEVADDEDAEELNLSAQCGNSIVEVNVDLIQDPEEDKEILLTIEAIYLNPKLHFELGSPEAEAFRRICENVVLTERGLHDCCRFYDSCNPTDTTLDIVSQTNDPSDPCHQALTAKFVGYCAPLCDTVKDSLYELVKHAAFLALTDITSEMEHLRKKAEKEEEIVRTPITGVRKPIILSKGKSPEGSDKSVSINGTVQYDADNDEDLTLAITAVFENPSSNNKSKFFSDPDETLDYFNTLDGVYRRVFEEANRKFDCCHFYINTNPLGGFHAEFEKDEDGTSRVIVTGYFDGYVGPQVDLRQTDMLETVKYICNELSVVIPFPIKKEEEIVRTPITGVRKPIILSKEDPTEEELMKLPENDLTEEEVAAAIDKKIAAEKVDGAYPAISINSESEMKTTKNPYLVGSITSNLDEFEHKQSDEPIEREGRFTVTYTINLNKLPVTLYEEVIRKAIGDKIQRTGFFPSSKCSLEYSKEYGSVDVIKYSNDEENRLMQICSEFTFIVSKVGTEQAAKLYPAFQKALMRKINENIREAFDEMRTHLHKYIGSGVFCDPSSKDNTPMCDAFMGCIRLDCPYLINKAPSAEEAEKFRRFFIDRFRKVKAEYAESLKKFPLLTVKLGNTRFSLSVDGNEGPDGKPSVFLIFPILLEKDPNEVYPIHCDDIVMQELQITMHDLEEIASRYFTFPE